MQQWENGSAREDPHKAGLAGCSNIFCANFEQVLVDQKVGLAGCSIVYCQNFEQVLVNHKVGLKGPKVGLWLYMKHTVFEGRPCVDSSSQILRCGPAQAGVWLCHPRPCAHLRSCLAMGAWGPWRARGPSR